jgi:outer membrane protein TolC
LGPNVLRLTLDEAKQRVLANSKLLDLAAHNVKSKAYATRAVKANYFPQIIGACVYVHFNEDLGQVLQFGGRSFRGPLGRDFLTIPSKTAAIPLINENSEFGTIAAIQPITDLLKVHAGVKIGKADEQIAQAQREEGTRELLSGVEQLFWGLLAAEQIETAAVQGVAAAEEAAKSKLPEAVLALVQAKQGQQQVENQVADLTEQLAILLDVPPGTRFELEQPPPPLPPVQTAEEAVSMALANSPEVREAEQNIKKARAAVAVAKVDYLPNVVVMGGYANNSGMIEPIQENFGYVGVGGTWTFVDWGKRKNTIRERGEIVAMAILKVQQTQDQVRQNTLKACREYEESRKAYQLAGELVEAQQAIEKAAKTPVAKLTAAKDLAQARVEFVKADLNQRITYVKLMALIGSAY